MSDTGFSVQKFLASNPLPNTPNPLVNETLAELRCRFWELWHSWTTDAMLDCAMALEGCAKSDRGAEFTRHWESWQKTLMDTIEEFFSNLFDIGTANVYCALPDPATWTCLTLYRLILENFVCIRGREHIVDYWIKHACLRRPIRIWESPVGLGFYGVSASDEQIRDSDTTIPILRESFEQMIWERLFGLRADALLWLAKDGWYRAAEDKPIVTLQDLKRLAPRDGRRHIFVYTIYPKLRQEISDARKANAMNKTANQEKPSIETIRQNFPLLGEAEDAVIKDLIMEKPNSTSDGTAAKEIISAFASISPGTVDRYTRRLPDVSSNSKELPGAQQLRLRLLRPEHLRDYEELLVTRNKCA